MPLDQPDISIRFPALGREFTSPIRYRIDSDYFVSTDAFEFELYHPTEAMTRGLELQPVEIYIDGALQLVGRVDSTEIGDSKAITIQGRDYLADMVECHVDPTFKILKGEPVALALQRLCWPVGIGSILGDEDLLLRNVRTGRNLESGAPPIAGFRELKMGDLKPDKGDGIFEFANRIAARFGATLQPGQYPGTLLFTAPNYTQAASYKLVVRDNNPANTVIQASARRDFSTLPTWAKLQGRGADKAKKHSDLNQDYLVAVYLSALNSGFFRDVGDDLIARTAIDRRLPDVQKTAALDRGKLYRLFYLSDPKSRDVKELDHALRRAISERAKDTLTYRATVRGHKDPTTGTVYAVDTIAEISDEIRRVEELLWISGRTFMFDENSGPTTELRMFRKDVIQL